jgi:hypothetical protein
MASHQRLASLPAELHALVARRHDDACDVLRSRLASPLLRGPAARAVRRLRTARGQLPAEAWQVFPEAAGLVVELDGGDSAPAALTQLAATLPARLEDLSISARDTTAHRLLREVMAEAAGLGTFLQQLLSHPCALRLKRLDALGVAVLPAAAKAVLDGLPSLEHCSMRIMSSGEGGQTQRSATFPAQLKHLQLVSVQARQFWVDAAGLAACSGLTSLELFLRGDRLDNLAAAMAACQQLRRLALGFYDAQEAVTAAELAAAGMPQLRSLSLRGVGFSPPQWQQLVQGLPRLEELAVQSVEICRSSPAAPCLTSFQGAAWLPAGGAFELVAVLPALQRLSAYGSALTIQDLPRALKGHPQLTELHLNTSEFLPTPLVPWTPGLLSGIPHLRRLELSGPAFTSGLDALLADAARCPQLEELQSALFDEPAGGLTDAALAALAEGACRAGLRSLVLDTCLLSYMLGQSCDDSTADTDTCFSLSSAARLLRPGALPKLQELQLDVVLPPGSTQADELQGQEAQQAHIVQLICKQLQACGVQVPAAGFHLVEFPHPEFPDVALRLPDGLALQGAVGECAVRLNVWLSCEDREGLGLDSDGGDGDQSEGPGSDSDGA